MKRTRAQKRRDLDIRKIIGFNIRWHRLEQGLTQLDLSLRCGFASNGKYISEIERGLRDLPLSTLRRIVEEGLNMDLDQII